MYLFVKINAAVELLKVPWRAQKNQGNSDSGNNADHDLQPPTTGARFLQIERRVSRTTGMRKQKAVQRWRENKKRCNTQVVQGRKPSFIQKRIRPTSDVVIACAPHQQKYRDNEHKAADFSPENAGLQNC